MSNHLSYRYFKTSPEIIQLDVMLVGGFSLLIWTAFGTTLLDRRFYKLLNKNDNIIKP